MEEIDSQVSERRDALPSLKRRREQLKQQGIEIKNKNGLLGNYDLLRDHEQKVVSKFDVWNLNLMDYMSDMPPQPYEKDATEKITLKIEELKQEHDIMRSEQQKVRRNLTKFQILKQHQVPLT